MAEDIRRLVDVLEADLKRFVDYMAEEQRIFDERMALLEYRMRQAEGILPNG